MNLYQFTFILGGVPDTEAWFDHIADAVHSLDVDPTVARNDGLRYVSASMKGPDAVSAACELVWSLTLALPEVDIVRLDADLVGIKNIAQRTETDLEEVQQWIANTERPFPPAEGFPDHQRVWRWPEVNEWLRPLNRADPMVYPTRNEAAIIDALLPYWRAAFPKGNKPTVPPHLLAPAGGE